MNNSGRGMQSFGVYDASKFPDYPAYTVGPDGKAIFETDTVIKSKNMDGK